MVQGVSKKMSFTELSICGFASNISPQLAVGAPIAIFDKTQFFLRHPVSHKKRDITNMGPQLTPVSGNIKHALNLGEQSTTAAATTTHDTNVNFNGKHCLLIGC